MAESTRGKSGARDAYTLELVGLQQGAERPATVVQALGAKGDVLLTAKVGAEGNFAIPPEVLKKARFVVIGAPRGEAVAAEGALRYRVGDFEAAAASGTLALGEGVWSRFRYSWHCVSGSVRVCRRRPAWFDALTWAAIEPTRAVASFRSASAKVSAGSAVAQLSPSIADVLAWPVRCAPVCLGTVEVFRRTCCCFPLVIDDWRIIDLIRDLDIVVGGLPKPKFPIPPPPPDPFMTPLFKGGGLNEMALNAAADLKALRSLPSDQAVQYVNSRLYLLRHICTCSRPERVASGAILGDGTFNVCWLEAPRLQQHNCHDEFAYVVKQTIGGATTTIYDGVAAGAWYHAGDHPQLTTYRPEAFSCGETGTGDGTAFVYLDQVAGINAYELNTPASTSWNSVGPPDATSGLMFP
ncbi:MAG TPA: hypothetical protein VIY56_00530, partial [Vicinamibacterales bacterium]